MNPEQHPDLHTSDRGDQHEAEGTEQCPCQQESLGRTAGPSEKSSQNFKKASQAPVARQVHKTTGKSNGAGLWPELRNQNFLLGHSSTLTLEAESKLNRPETTGAKESSVTMEKGKEEGNRRTGGRRKGGRGILILWGEKNRKRSALEPPCSKSSLELPSLIEVQEDSFPLNTSDIRRLPSNSTQFF